MLGQEQQYLSNLSSLMLNQQKVTIMHFFRARGQSPDTQLSLFTDNLHLVIKHNKRNHIVEVNLQITAIPPETRSRVGVCQATCQRARHQNMLYILVIGEFS